MEPGKRKPGRPPKPREPRSGISGVAHRAGWIAIRPSLRLRIKRISGKLTLDAWVYRAIDEKLARDEPADEYGIVIRGSDMPELPAVRGSARVEFGEDLDFSERTRLLRAIRMMNEGVDDAEVAKRLGYRTGHVMRDLAERKFAELMVHETEDYFHSALHELQATIRDCRDSARNPGWLFDVKGDLLTGPDGRPQVNIRERVNANAVLITALKEFIHMMALARAPQKYQSVGQAELARLIKNALMADGLDEDDAGEIIDAVIAES